MRERLMRVQPRALAHGFLPPRFDDEDDYPAGERPVVSRISTATFLFRDPPRTPPRAPPAPRPRLPRRGGGPAQEPDGGRGALLDVGQGARLRRRALGARGEVLVLLHLEAGAEGMSVRGLGPWPRSSSLLCVAAAVLLVDRLGWWGRRKPVDWTFVNPTLSVARGQRVVFARSSRGCRRSATRSSSPSTGAGDGRSDGARPVPAARASRSGSATSGSTGLRRPRSRSASWAR